MSVNLKKNQFYAFATVILLLFSTADDLIAQKRRPTRTTAKQDSTKLKEGEKANAALPTLNLREYTITGQNRVRILPSQRRAIEIADITTIERNADLEGKEDRTAPGSGGDKKGGTYETPLTGVMNELYGAFGRYTDINLGANLRKQYTGDEYYGNLDIHLNDGHILNAESKYVKANAANIHRFTNYLQTNTMLSFNWHDYNFYGAETTPTASRNGYDLDLSAIADFTKWSPTNFRFEVGGKYNNPDESDIFNWDLRSALYWSSIVKSTFIKGTIAFNTDRVKDSRFDNAPISTANYSSALLTVEKLLTPRFHVKIGGAFFGFESENAQRLYTVSPDNGQLSVTLPQEIKFKENKVYPQLAVRYDMGDAGRFFVEFEPGVESFTLTEKLNYNPYLNLVSPLSYEVRSHDMKIGWRRSYAYDLSFEIFYNDKKVENYGIIDDSGLESSESPGRGRWNYIYDNDVDFNEYRAIVNWKPNPKVNIWSSFSYTDLTISKSAFAVRLPYYPDVTFDFNIQTFPGAGFQVLLNGQFIGERETSAFGSNNVNNTLDPFVLANITVSKQLSESIGVYAYGANLFNEKYELWRGYEAPELNGGAGLRFFW